MPDARQLAVVLCLAAVAFADSDAPTVRAVYRPSPPAIAVTASDSAGLDSIQLSCPSLDLTYTTQLSRAGVDKRFERTFPLSEVFPGWEKSAGPLRVTVTVRNTRGVTASATVAVPHGSSAKPN
jgi:hypothetical protein